MANCHDLEARHQWAEMRKYWRWAEEERRRANTALDSHDERGLLRSAGWCKQQAAKACWSALWHRQQARLVGHK